MAASLLSRAWFFILLLVFLFGFAKAQPSLSRYAFSTSTGNSYSPNPILTKTMPSLIGNNDEGYVNDINIGFDFWYMGKRYEKVSASTNGWFTLGGAISSGTISPGNNLASGGVRPVIAPLWDNLRVNPGLIDVLLPGSFSHQLSGTAPNRVLTLEWYMMQWNNSATYTVLVLTVPSNVISFQAKIHENGNIVFMYSPGPQPVVGGSASVGITAVGGGANNFISVSKIADGGPAIDTTRAAESSNINVKPSSGRMITFDPVEVAAPTNLTFTNVGSSGITLNWIDNSTNEAGFAIYRSTDGIEFIHVANTAANVLTYNDVGLTTGVNYYYRVHAFRENLSSGATGNQITSCQNFTLANIPTGNILANYKFNGNANDLYGLNQGILQGSPTPVVNRFNTPGTAYQFNGSNQYVSTTIAYDNPVGFTISVWFKTTTAGGKLIGLGSNQTGFSSKADRHIYMGNDGKLHFGVKPGGTTYWTVSSVNSYSDGNWHMATATMSNPGGIKLYIDGVLVSQNATVLTAENYIGYLRLGYDNIDGWPSTPSNQFFSGVLDDAYVYGRALSDAEVLTLYNASEGVGNTSPVCAGTTLTLTANAVSGASYSWVGPNGFTSSAQNPTLSFSDAAKGVYTVTVSRNGCVISASTNVTTTGLGQWTGNAGTNWGAPNSWCSGTVPLVSTDVFIPAALTNYPVVSDAQFANNLMLASGASLTVNNSLTIRGQIISSGVFNVVNGGVVLNGTVAQSISANVFSNNLIKDLTTSNNAGVTLNGQLRLTGVLTATAGIFNANGHLTLAASETATAQVAPIPASASVRGQVKVERFIKGGSVNPYRGYRMLSSPVYDNTTDFINTNVEGNRTSKFVQLKDDIIVTGTGGAANGFDPSHNNHTSAWTYNFDYVRIPNINTAVNAGRGMYVLFRGNRDNISVKTYPPYPDAETVVMDFDGVLNQQDVTATLSYSATLGGFNLLGNPYAATIDWISPNWQASDKVNVHNAVWWWHPVNRGYATFIDGVGAAGGSQYIPSGQSFFVEASAAGSVRFKESIKAGAEQSFITPIVLSSRNQEWAAPQVASERSLVRIVMKPLASYGEDETVIVFDRNSNAAFTSEDALHFDGEMVNISSLAGGESLAINFLPPKTSAMEIDLNVSSAFSGNYMMKFNLEEYFQGYTLKLKDKHLKQTTTIDPEGVYSFNIDLANNQTFGAARFSVVVEPPTVLPLGLFGFTGKKQNQGVLLTWEATDDVKNTKAYKLYRAGNDGNYAWLADISPLGTGGYSFLDATPLIGHNYYKLVKVDLHGEETWTDPVVVNFAVGATDAVLIYPNPVKEKFTIKVDDLLVQDKYKLNLYDVLGKKWKSDQVSKIDFHNGYEVDVAGLASGFFFVEIANIETGKVIVSRKIVKY